MSTSENTKEGKYVSEPQNLARKDHRGNFQLSGRQLSVNGEQVHSVSPYQWRDQDLNLYSGVITDINRLSSVINKLDGLQEKTSLDWHNHESNKLLIKHYQVKVILLNPEFKRKMKRRITWCGGNVHLF